MMEMKEQTGSRKKLLVPVVVLMLCLVALTGAAYAYSSTLQYSENTVNAKDLTVDLKGGSVSETSIAPGATGAVVFTDHYEYTGPAASNKYDTVKCEIDDALIWTITVTISGNAPVKNLEVSSTNIEAFYAQHFNGASGTTVGSKLAIKVAVVAASAAVPDISAATELEDNDTVVTLQNVATGDYKIYVFVDGASAEQFDVRAKSVVAAENDQNAQFFKNTFNAFKFALKFEATEPTA